MSFNEQLPGWNAPGVEPPASKKNAGFEPGEKPPADYFNWLFTRVSKVTEELQQKALETDALEAHEARTDNPHSVTAAQVGAIPTSQKGVAGGVASLDSGGKIPDAQIPASITRDTELTAHTSAGTAHGSTSAATAGAIMQRDANGQANVGAPTANTHIARKQDADAALSAAQAAQATANAALPKDGSEAMTGRLKMDPYASGYSKEIEFFYVEGGTKKSKLLSVDPTGKLIFTVPGVAMYDVITSAGGTLIDNLIFGSPTSAGEHKGNVRSYLSDRYPGWAWYSANTPKSQIIVDVSSADMYIDGAGKLYKRDAFDSGTPQEIWDRGDLRWNPAGYLEYNDGGTWRPVGGIKSVQRGEFEYGAGAAMPDIVINAVSVNKAFAIVQSTGNDFPYSVYGVLVNATSLRLIRQGGNGVSKGSWQVVEFY